MRKMVAQANQTISQFEQNPSGHPYCDAYVNRNGTDNGHAINHVNGNDNMISTSVVSNGLQGFETALLEKDGATAFGMKKNLKTIFAGDSL